MKNYYYLNGEILPSDQGAISVFDRGIFYGDGLFETLRVYQGQPFLLEKHLDRILQGAAELDLNPPSRSKLETAAREIIKSNHIVEGSLRLVLTRGIGTRGLWPHNTADVQTTVIVTGSSNAPYKEEQYQRGFKATMISFPRNELSPLVRLKSLNFLENILGRREAFKQGADEGLFTNRKGHLTEGTVSNLFIIRDGMLYTPPGTAGILKGITRNLILELAKDICDVTEENFSPLFLTQADEAFLTNSLVEIISLVQVGRHTIADGKPGNITLKLRQNYQEYTSSIF